MRVSKQKMCTAALALFIATTSGAASAESYLCVVEKVTGFFLKNNDWVHTRFKDGGKWLISLENGGKATEFGREYSLFDNEDCQTFTTFISCHNNFGHMKMATDTLRFSTSYTHGFVDGTENNDNTPTISIGTCAKM